MRLLRSFLALLLTVAIAHADHHGIKAGSAAKPGSVSKTGSGSKGDGWVELFNGKDFTGWKAVENPTSWRIEDGEMVAHGPRSMLYYVGKVQGANFRDFVWECEVLLKPNANSGMYFHTQMKEEGWPSHGYEAQLNNTHGDRRKTGSIYNVKDLLDKSPAEDNKWFVQRVTVRGKRVQVHVDGRLINDYVEPDNLEPPQSRPHRRFASGTFSLQGHDPGSEVRFRRVRVKVLEPKKPAPTPSA